jgi:hypothetical protein
MILNPSCYFFFDEVGSISFVLIMWNVGFVYCHKIDTPSESQIALCQVVAFLPT